MTRRAGFPQQCATCGHHSRKQKSVLAREYGWTFTLIYDAWVAVCGICHN